MRVGRYFALGNTCPVQLFLVYNCLSSTDARYLNGSVGKDTVSDDVVVVEVSTDDRWSEVNYDTSYVDHQNAEHGTADTASVLGRRRRTGGRVMT